MGERECVHTESLWPFNNSWLLKPLPSQVAFWKLVYPSEIIQYCCRRCNFGGITVPIYGKMRYHASRCNGSTDEQQTILSGKSISLFSSFRTHKTEMFSSVDLARHQAQECCRIVVSLRPQKLLLMTIKQRRLLMLFLTTVKQRRLLLLLLTTVFSF